MNRVAVAFSTKDRTELSIRSVEPLLQPDKFDLFWCDGSTTEEGRTLPHKVALAAGENHRVSVYSDVRGGPDAAIVYALTTMLAGSDYTHVGLIENDVLLAPDWFDKTMELFDAGEKDGLAVGAASPRCYADRILVQRDGYAVMHNLGAGAVVFTRTAARLVLDHFRTGWTTDNRSVFAVLAGTDIGRYWAFKGGEHWLCADWGFDRVLAAHGYASVALTPSPVEMIGQVPPLDEQGLILADREIEEFRTGLMGIHMGIYRGELARIREGALALPDQMRHRDRDGEMIFAHQIGLIGGNYSGDDSAYFGGWRLKWYQGFGPFAYAAYAPLAWVDFPILGPCHVLIRGGESPGRFRIADEHSGFEIEPMLQPGIMMAAFVPSGCTYRTIRVTALDPGVIFHGVQCAQPQPSVPSFRFDWNMLPRV